MWISYIQYNYKLRAEGYGMYARLYFLTLVCIFLSITLQLLKCACDNQGLIIRLTSCLQYTYLFPNLTLVPNWDLVKVCQALTKSFHQIMFEHVKGHQDKIPP